jgi:two-component system, OmpR family, sensor histidine kinase MprB
MSLRRRLILLAAGAVALAVIAGAVGSYVAVSNELHGQVDDRLERTAEALQEAPPLATTVSAPEIIRRRLREVPEDAGPSIVGLGDGDARVQLIEPGGAPVGILRADPPLPVSGADREVASSGEGQVFTETDVGGTHLRVLTAPLPDGGAVQVADSLEGVDDVLSRLRIALLVVVLGGVALAGVLAWLLSRTVIGPIKGLTEAAEHIGETQDLSRRISASGEDELGRLAARFNAMLDTIERSQHALASSVTAQRQLVADASHELRTPVASLRTDIESLLEHPELAADERTRVLADVDARIEELTALINDVIELARGDEPNGRVEPVRLDEIVGGCVAKMKSLSPPREITLSIESTVVEGRSDRIARAVNNLLDNARKYSPADTPIEVTVADGEVTVRDHGGGIAPEELEHVFDRFYRGLDSRREPGSGLGLAIVRQVAESHRGEATASAAEGGGTVFTLRLGGGRPRSTP